MIYQVKLTFFVNRVAKTFNPGVKKSAKAALKELAEDPFLGKELQAELSGFRSYKFQRYRIIFKTNTREKIIIVWAIGHQRDIYETFSEHLLSLSPEDEEGEMPPLQG
ncbi:MAG: type II toxin-antitoxin system RelE/ParE family toxin [Desulfobulbaceae bacterium]|nr:type II toxin-antitoxin system RelE/ParE family toxin [Desulfobulbaceae bacterium]